MEDEGRGGVAVDEAEDDATEMLQPRASEEEPSLHPAVQSPLNYITK